MILLLPAVCAVVGTRKFKKEYGVERIKMKGPINGANATFIFKITKSGIDKR